MLGDVIQKSLISYLLVIVIGFMIALVIKVIVVLLSRSAEKEASKTPVATAAASRRAAPVPLGIPAHHLVAIVAAAESIAGSRIVRINDIGLDQSWISVGRSIHQSSHDVRHR